MNPSVFGELAILAYIAAFAALIWTIHSEAGRPRRYCALLSGWLAVSLHGLSLLNFEGGSAILNLNFLSALSLVSLLVVTMVLLASLTQPTEKLGVFAFPLAAIMLGLKLAIPEDIRTISERSWPMTLHILSSLTAYSFLNIAAIQSVLLAFQDWALRSHHQEGKLVRSLPSVQAMENLLFQLIGSGLTLLTVSLVSGFMFLNDMFAQHLAHKTILSILAWLVFGGLLAGRRYCGWRGQMAVRWTIGGFVSLMLAYFGSKMVLELILNRS